MAKIKTSRGGKTKEVPASRSLPTVISSLEDIISNKQSPVDIKKFAYIFMDKIGGPAGFVDKVMEEYEGSGIGSLARARVLEIMMRLFQLATPKETFGDYTDVSDEDLARMLKDKLGPVKQVPENPWIDHVCI